MPRRPLNGARISAAATELRRSRCYDGAAQTSSVALILRVASERRDAQNDENSIHFPPCWVLIEISMVVAHSPRPPLAPNRRKGPPQTLQ